MYWLHHHLRAHCVPPAAGNYCSTSSWHSCVNARIMTPWLFAFFFFLSSSLTHLLLSCSLFLCNGLTHHRWVCVVTSSEVLQGHMHDGQVNKQAGLGCRDVGSWSKFRITGKSQSSLQGHIFSSGMITKNVLWSAAHSVSLTGYCLFLMTVLTKTYSIMKYDMYSDQFPFCLCHTVSNNKTRCEQMHCCQMKGWNGSLTGF